MAKNDDANKENNANNDENKNQGQENAGSGQENKNDKNENKDQGGSEVEALKKQVGDLSRQLGETREFIEGASSLVNLIGGNEDLSKAVREAALRNQGVQTQQQNQGNKDPNAGQGGNGKNPTVDPTVRDLAASQRDSLIQDFEQRYGFSDMKPDEVKEIRRGIEEFHNNFGWSVQTMPLSQLKSSLEKAYLATHAGKLKEEGRLEGMTQARNNAYGKLPSASGGSLPTQEESGKLTDAQRKWVDKLGVNPEKAEKVYKERDKEEKRVPKKADK